MVLPAILTGIMAARWPVQPARPARPPRDRATGSGAVTAATPARQGAAGIVLPGGPEPVRAAWCRIPVPQMPAPREGRQS